MVFSELLTVNRREKTRVEVSDTVEIIWAVQSSPKVQYAVFVLRGKMFGAMFINVLYVAPRLKVGDKVRLFSIPCRSMKRKENPTWFEVL